MSRGSATTWRRPVLLRSGLGPPFPLKLRDLGGGRPKTVRLGVRPVGSAGVYLQMTLALCGTSGGVQG